MPIAGRNLTFAHFSDIHLPPEAPLTARACLTKQLIGWMFWSMHRRHRHSRSALETLLMDAVSLGSDHMVLTGDIVNFALKHEIQRARNWLGTLGEPHQVTVVPGNHDIYVSGADRQVFRTWRPWLCDGPFDEPMRYPSVRRRGNVAFVLVNTALPRPPFDASGRIGFEQLARLETVLKALRREDCLRVVLMHHPPNRSGVPWSRRLIDYREFQGVIARVGADLILFGHNHVAGLASIEGADRTVPVICAPSASSRVQGPRRGAGYYRWEVREEESSFVVEGALRSLSMEGFVESTAEHAFRFVRKRRHLRVESVGFGLKEVNKPVRDSADLFPVGDGRIANGHSSVRRNPREGSRGSRRGGRTRQGQHRLIAPFATGHPAKLPREDELERAKPGTDVRKDPPVDAESRNRPLIGPVNGGPDDSESGSSHANYAISPFDNPREAMPPMRQHGKGAAIGESRGLRGTASHAPIVADMPWKQVKVVLLDRGWNADDAVRRSRSVRVGGKECANAFGTSEKELQVVLDPSGRATAPLKRKSGSQSQVCATAWFREGA